MFIRFVVGSDGDDHRNLTGVFAEACILRDDGKLSDYEESTLAAAYRWFNKHVPVPPFESRAWPRDAVTWFKDDAGESLQQIWHLVALLREHGFLVRLLRSRNPGKILYEDEFQAVVLEWKHL